ncbi:hypothetical protein LZD49_35410 [Dyadobacter sp. CY261]|uniref:hypothetical protein n=1 Tax=Dyadobacter sp. CY261 TaxID=2907203 RepID=UPI001F28E8DA|nr:hypothetical protein [Dyadobacter sp. CY261]MCF0075808.1 hypothetical protein [Dyadobacter sp. CY261]
MFQIIFYVVFFGIVDLFIYFKLQKSAQFQSEYVVYLLIIAVTVAHMGIWRNGILMSSEDFFHLGFFSIALVILHYGTNLQLSLTRKRQGLKIEQRNQLPVALFRIFDLMRQKLIYLGIGLYQFLAICDESLR